MDINALRTFVGKQAKLITRQFYMDENNARKCICLEKQEILTLYAERCAEVLAFEETKKKFRAKDAIDPVDIDGRYAVSFVLFYIMLGFQPYFMFSALAIICCNVGLPAVFYVFSPR